MADGRGRAERQPRTARTWFSNWLVTAPSIVQWPELCTRGAISFASSARADEELDREHADVVEVLEQALQVRVAPLAAARALRCGRERAAQDAARCACSPTSG